MTSHDHVCSISALSFGGQLTVAFQLNRKIFLGIDSFSCQASVMAISPASPCWFEEGIVFIIFRMFDDQSFPYNAKWSWLIDPTELVSHGKMIQKNQLLINRYRHLTFWTAGDLPSVQSGELRLTGGSPSTWLPNLFTNEVYEWWSTMFLMQPLQLAEQL